MKLRTLENINAFIEEVEKCTGDVFLTSMYGDKFNLKSKLSQYVAIGALLGEHGEDLELWCYNKDDENRMLNFLGAHPDIL